MPRWGSFFGSEIKTIEKDESESKKLSIAFKNLTEMDMKLIPSDTDDILTLDLTENNFTGQTDLRFLFEFSNLETLILDKNQIQSKFLIPCMEKLKTLWVNHNNIQNLVVFIENLQMFCPNLRYLSMLNNKAAPSYFNGGSLIEYNDFRLYVISRLKKLENIDANEITAEERMQSQAIYGTGRLARYNDFSVDKQLKRRRSTLLNNKGRKYSQNPLNLETNNHLIKTARKDRKKSVRKSQGTLSKITQDSDKILSQPESNDMDDSTENMKSNSSRNIKISEEIVEQLETSNTKIKTRPPSPSLAMLNELERTNLSLDNSILALKLAPPPPPPLPSFFN